MHLSLLSVSVFVAVISAIRIPSDPASFPLAQTCYLLAHEAPSLVLYLGMTKGWIEKP